MSGKENGIRMLAVIGLLLVAMFAMVTTAEAAQDLKITDYNLHALKYWGTWTPYSYGELLRWEYGPTILDARYQRQKWIGNIPAITVADHQGYYWGECVSLTKALSKSTVTTRNWQKGDNVVFSIWQGSPARPGEVIATFGASDGGYYGHAAIFKGYVFDSRGRVIGIQVWDQNYLPYKGKVVARHTIWTTGRTLETNANNYYTVRV